MSEEATIDNQVAAYIALIVKHYGEVRIPFEEAEAAEAAALEAEAMGLPPPGSEFGGPPQGPPGKGGFPPKGGPPKQGGFPPGAPPAPPPGKGFAPVKAKSDMEKAVAEEDDLVEKSTLKKALTSGKGKVVNVRKSTLDLTLDDLTVILNNR